MITPSAWTTPFSQQVGLLLSDDAVGHSLGHSSFSRFLHAGVQLVTVDGGHEVTQGAVLTRQR